VASLTSGKLRYALAEMAALVRIMPAAAAPAAEAVLDQAPAAPAPSTAEVRAWARARGLPVPDRGKLRPEIWEAWRSAASAGSQ
jgi:hypothetical protein